MKTTFFAALIVTSIALAALCLNEQAQIQDDAARLSQAEGQIAALKAELNARDEAIVHAKFTAAKADILQQTLAETTASAVDSSKKAEQLQQSLAAAKTNNPMRGLSAMFKDPKMREMMKSQQKAYMGPMIDKQYAALFQQLNLTSEQGATLKDLLQKKLLANADAGFSMLDDSLDASQRADLSKQMKSQTDEIDSQIKQLLGDENYPAFQSYEKTLPDRTVVGQFNDQLAGTASALTAAQQNELIQEMTDARSNFKWSVNFNRQNPANGDYAAMFTEENINKFAQQQEQFDQQFLSRAQQILTPDQLAAFQDFQKTQRQLQVAGMKMAAQMLAPAEK